jgi:arabinogalactan endo-1,4-beta-galactosidase
VKAGIAGVEAGKGNEPRPRIMIHIDRGGDKIRTKDFFDKLNSYHVNYDVIGQSYYPWWHGSLNDLRENMISMAQEYKRDIILVEVAYNWKTAEYLKRPPPFPETPKGQKEFLVEVNRVVQETPGGLGKGVFWWEPAASGPLVSRSFFDDDGNALPVITAFDKFTRH